MAKRLEKPSSLPEILGAGRLASYRQDAGRLNRLNAILATYMDAGLKPLVHVASYQEGVLSLACHNSSLAGQLRYLSRIYMQQLRQHDEFCELVRIRVVNTATTVAGPSPSRPRLARLSTGTATLLAELADTLQGGEVSEALRRLASHGDGAEKGPKPESTN
ncbi:MAG: DciA family protein [Moraxellaceae bacterium]|nr:DciA family protein [Moraxellaceae bacterium]